MKIKHIVSFVALLSVAATASAQTLRGRVTDQQGEPLIGASVDWAETTVGSSTAADGGFTIYRVRNYDRLVASYLGYENDTLQVAAGLEQVEFRLRAEGVAVESVVVEGTQSGNFVKRDGIMKNEMISFAGLCKMACCNLVHHTEPAFQRHQI